MDISEIRLLFAYNEWANARVLHTASDLNEERFTRGLVSSFPSIRDTLSHIVAVEWLWLRRWTGESPSVFPEWAASPKAETLRHRLSEVEAERASFLAGIGDQDVDRPISYTNLQGERWRYRLVELLLHLVNHSTYHRGQVTTMLRQVGAVPLPTDLLVFKDQPSP